jgi:hypothetical protein
MPIRPDRNAQLHRAELYLANAGATIRVLLLEADLCQIEMAIVCSGF